MPSSKLVAPVLALAALAGCSAEIEPATGPSGKEGAPQVISVRVNPATATVAHGGLAQLAADVTGTMNPAVTWTVVEPGNVGTVSSTGLYQAPAATGTFHVRARSVADSTAFGDAAVTVAPLCTGFTYTAWGGCSAGVQTRTVVSSLPSGCLGGAPVLSQPCSVLPVTVTISPRTATVDACTTRTFTATVANASDPSVTWSVQEGAAGGSVTGGVYTAPEAAGTYHLVATSVADAFVSDVATVTVADRVLSVTVSPASARIATGASIQLTATIRTTCREYQSPVALGPQ